MDIFFFFFESGYLIFNEREKKSSFEKKFQRKSLVGKAYTAWDYG